MTRLDDETLMAYADGALDAATRIDVERQLAGDPEARRTVELFRNSSVIARQAFDAPMTAPPPAALVDLILSHPTAVAAPPIDKTVEPASGQPGSVVAFDPERRRERGSVSKLTLSLAASLALAIGVGAGYLASRGPVVDPASGTLALGPVANGSAVARVLERNRTGEATGRVVVVATFRDRNDRICREVEHVGGNAQVEFAGVACRQPGGTWVIEGAARVAVSTAPATGDFKPSGANEKDALSSLLSMLGATTILTPTEEKALLDRGWN